MVELKHIVVGIAIFGGVVDLLTKRIPNWWTFGAMCIGIAVQFWNGGWGEAGAALLGIAVGFGLFFPLFALGIMGAGDVKLLMAVGAWTNATFCVRVAVLSLFAGAAFAIVEMIYRGRMWPFLKSLWHFSQALLFRGGLRPNLDIDKQRKFSFGPALACAVLLVVFLEQNGVFL